jgi:outer membrane cobalamin receptor
MSTRVSFEYRNILNEQYETVPGYTMPPRHYRVGLFWELFD